MPLPPISKPSGWLAGLAGGFSGLDTAIQRREEGKREDAKAALAAMLAQGQMKNYASEDAFRQAQAGNLNADNIRADAAARAKTDEAKVAEAERRVKITMPGQRLDEPTADLFDFAHVPLQWGFDPAQSTAPTPLRIPGLDGSTPTLSLPSAKLGDTWRARQETPADVTAAADLASKNAATIKTTRETTDAAVKADRVEKARAKLDEATALGKNIYAPEFSIARADAGVGAPPNEGVQQVEGPGGKPVITRTAESYGQPAYVKPPDALSEALKQAALDAAKEKAAPLDVSSEIETTSTGKRWVDASKFATAAGKDKARVAVHDANAVLVTDHNMVAHLKDIETARLNQASVMDAIKATLPKDAASRAQQAAGIKLSSLFQSDGSGAIRAAYGAWRTSAIQTLRALAGGQGSGLRINQAEIQMALDNDIPKDTDSLQVAINKFNAIGTQLDNGETGILGAAATPTPGTGRGGGAGPTGGPPAGKIEVTAPDGSKHAFDTQAQADAFKKLIAPPPSGGRGGGGGGQ